MLIRHLSCGTFKSFLCSLSMNVNRIGMLRVFSIGVAFCLFLGCIAENDMEDGLVEATGKVTRASLSLDESGEGEVQFEYAYLIGVKDSEGIGQFDWVFRLINPAREIYGETSQLMREADADNDLIYVQGTKPRVLSVNVPTDQLSGPFVLWITVEYETDIVTELFVELENGVEFVDATPMRKLVRFAQGT